jgi:hypothetical protein
MKTVIFTVHSDGSITPACPPHTKHAHVGDRVKIEAGHGVNPDIEIYAMWGEQECCQPLFGVDYMRVHEHYTILQVGPNPQQKYSITAETDGRTKADRKAGDGTTVGTNGEIHIGSTGGDDPQ